MKKKKKKKKKKNVCSTILPGIDCLKVYSLYNINTIYLYIYNIHDYYITILYNGI